MRHSSSLVLGVLFMLVAVAHAGPLEPVSKVELQPLSAQVRRVKDALMLVGAPLTEQQSMRLDRAMDDTDEKRAVREIQAVLDPLCLAAVNINPESRVKAAIGPAAPKLIQQGWRTFLIKVHNEGGVTAPLRVTSPNAATIYTKSTNKPSPTATVKSRQVDDRWLQLDMHNGQPLSPTLSGLALEYRILELFSRDAGRREGKLMFDVGQGTQDLGFRNELNVLFQCDRAVDVVLGVLDVDSKPTTGHFLFRDALGRVYPFPARRKAPDFFFQEQVYRADGESVTLPPGEYTVTYGRGPEYRQLEKKISVPNAASHREMFRLQRWIHLADLGWYSGDHHIHAAGCAHYDSPTEGVEPADMLRHVMGEDLNVGCVLSWGPCWYHQKQFFDGQVNKLSKPRHLMRYDVEVSGFPSSPSGHLVLLRLKEDDYPGTTRIDQWPSWDLPILKWGKSQGAIVGFAHSGNGLMVPATKLPTYDMPPFDGIGANEYIVDVAHDACDFISTVDTQSIWELNIWYHTLNCGFTCRISGETDFPCVYGDRVGMGRAYVKLPVDRLDYDRWAEGIRDGRSYCCDGLSHLIDFKAGDLGVGEIGAAGRASVIRASKGSDIEFSVRAAALLGEKPREDIRRAALDQKPYWHIERARIGDTRQVPVELIVNGVSVEQRPIAADGSIQGLKFHFKPTKSSWVALRIFPSSHTNPVFVEVDGQPIRASRRSAKWCLDAVDVCWKQKKPLIRAEEQPAAAAAYEQARKVYRTILDQSPSD